MSHVKGPDRAKQAGAQESRCVENRVTCAGHGFTNNSAMGRASHCQQPERNIRAYGQRGTRGAVPKGDMDDQ